jgi:DNA-binding NarL/FixJ family response regulator
MGQVLAGSQLREVIEKIESVRVGEASVGFVPELRAALGFDALVYARPIERPRGWAVERFEADGLANPTRMRRALNEYLDTATTPVPWLDLRQPSADERNCAVDVQTVVGAAAYRASALYQRVIATTELAEHWLLRVLICDGPSVVAWLGGFSARATTRQQADALTTIAGPLQTRLRIERVLGSAPRIHAALDATLQQIGAPALLVDVRGRVHEMNRAGRELLATRREELMSSIAAVLAKQIPVLPVTLTPVSAAGFPEQFLAVVRPRTAEARMALCVTLAANRWRLTPRQVDVLRLLVRGGSNAQIANELGTSPRAVELHITAIFESANVVNRSQLVAAVLLG